MDLALFTFLSLALSPAPAPIPFLAAAPPPRAAQVTSIRIDKSDHRLTLMAGDSAFKTFSVALGVGGAGPKRFEGDKTTPVGVYTVRGRFRGLFHQFLNVTYPNDDDRRRFDQLKQKGEVPEGRGIGFGIGIHGVGSPELQGVHKTRDWTHGCIALDDDEIDELSSLVRDGTTIVITD